MKRACCCSLPQLLASARRWSTAQGVTSAAFNGTVIDTEGKALPGATVKAVHVPTGTVYATTPATDGMFDILGVRVGGPYTVTVTMDPGSPPRR